jgi:hypothetical protein
MRTYKTTNQNSQNLEFSLLDSKFEKKHQSIILLTSHFTSFTNHFNKIHKRKWASFGCGHEPGENMR